MTASTQNVFSISRKHIQPFVLAGLFFLGACGTQNQSDNESASLYESNCASCPDSGSFGAPKLGNKEAWHGRMAEGKDVMIKKAITGIDGKIGMMPPRGGNTSLSDEDVKAAILYMTSKINTSSENTTPESPVL